MYSYFVTFVRISHFESRAHASNAKMQNKMKLCRTISVERIHFHPASPQVNAARRRKSFQFSSSLNSVDRIGKKYSQSILTVLQCPSLDTLHNSFFRDLLLNNSIPLAQLTQPIHFAPVSYRRR